MENKTLVKNVQFVETLSNEDKVKCGEGVCDGRFISLRKA